MKNRFTIQIRGNVDHDSQQALLEQMQQVLSTFPQFKLTFSSVEVWQDMNGEARVYNDDGTEYVEPVEESTVQPSAQPEIEEVVA